MLLVATIGDICTCVFVLYCNRVQRREVVAIIEDRQIVMDKFINLNFGNHHYYFHYGTEAIQ